MVSREVGGHLRACPGPQGVTLLCFGRLKGGQCDSEGWHENGEDLGSPSQEGLHVGAGARGTVPSPHSLSPVSAFPRGDGKSFGGFSGVLSRGERGCGSFLCELPAGASFPHPSFF